jgi:hypothetical protein
VESKSCITREVERRNRINMTLKDIPGFFEKMEGVEIEAWDEFEAKTDWKEGDRTERYENDEKPREW